MIRAVQIGPAPMLTEVAWSKGRYDSYVLSPDGSMIGTVHPPGLAWRVNNNCIIPKEMTFLSSRNQRCRGRWFVAALLPCPFKRLHTGSSFLCQLILVMGVKATVGNSLMEREVHIYYYKMRHDLSDSAISDLFKSVPNKKEFITTIFESSLTVGSEKTTQRIQLLNQISGPTLEGWKLTDSTTEVDGVQYHQCRLGPDQWLDRGNIVKDSEFGIQLTTTRLSQWQPHPQHLRNKCNDNVAHISGTKSSSQFVGSNVLITYTTRKKSCGRYMWMPLPISPLGYRDFALITMDQKIELDNIFFNEEESLMEPCTFRDLVIDMTIENGFDSFFRLLVLSCGASYFGNICKMFIVSIVSDTEMEVLRANNMSSIAVDDEEEKCFGISDINLQDPHVAGTVVFRGYVCPTICPIGMDEVGLVMSSYHSSSERRITGNQGVFHMTEERQSNMASRSMGVCDDSAHHHYYNNTSTNTLMLPFTSPLAKILNVVTTQAQDSSGQVVIGLIRKSFNTLHDMLHIGSDKVCPYGILTCPRHDKKKGVLESFSNCGHRDSTDCTNVQQGLTVLSYLQQTKNNTVVMEYLQRMYSNFGDIIDSPKLPLPTTCCWKGIEDPAEYSFKHISYFVVVDAGIAWDLSSDVFTHDIGTISGTFFGKLVEHLTSCSLYEEVVTGWVTTLCPGNACNIAWGTSGGSKKLKLIAATSKSLQKSKTVTE